jgi:CBS domain containing-hemolysin-like protein
VDYYKSMIALFIGVGCMTLALVALVLQRLYSSVPLRELKRLSSRGDMLAQGLYRPAAYGASLRALLWLLAIGLLAAGTVLVASAVPPIAAVAVTGIAVALALVWAPTLHLTIAGARFATIVAPAITMVLRHAHRPLAAIARAGNRLRTFSGHSRLYEKEDLTNLLRKQKTQQDNRISLTDLELAHRALQFGDKHAADIVQPRKQTLLVQADDSIGPILLDQLHKSGQTSFLVYQDDTNTVVGSLLMRDAVKARQGGKVRGLVRNDICYVHEDFSLVQVLAAFQKTGHHTVVVINSFEEFVGVITLARLVEELMGASAADTIDNFEDRATIAAYTEPPASAVPDEEQMLAAQTSPEATEVIK